MTKVVAVIPIKTNNQRLPGKNTKILGDYPLYHFMFTTVKKVQNIDEVWVDSSDPEILSIASDYGFKTIKRPTELNSPHTSGHDLINFEIKNTNLKRDDIFVQLFVTQPFITYSTIQTSIDKLLVSRGKTSILSLFPVENRFWYNNTPVSHSPTLLKGTQYEEPVYCEAGYYIFKVGAFLNEQSRITKDFIPYYVDSSQCLDIDNEIDFKLAEYYLENKLI